MILHVTVWEEKPIGLGVLNAIEPIYVECAFVYVKSEWLHVWQPTQQPTANRIVHSDTKRNRVKGSESVRVYEWRKQSNMNGMKWNIHNGMQNHQ